jgi:hypothetical protein
MGLGWFRWARREGEMEGRREEGVPVVMRGRA